MQKVCFVIRFSFCFCLFCSASIAQRKYPPDEEQNLHHCILTRIGANMYNVYIFLFKTQGSSVKQKRLMNATAQLGFVNYRKLLNRMGLIQNT